MNNSLLTSNQIIPTLEGILCPARGKLDQYEFEIPSVIYINAMWPLISGNPYTLTASKTKGQRCKGKTVTCKFQNYTVIGQFHRSQEEGIGIWIGSDWTNRRKTATLEWHNFMKKFGINVCVDNKKIPVYLDFYANFVIIIRLISSSVPKE